MKKRTIITHAAVVCLLVFAFVGGNVAAQRGVPSSRKDDSGPTANYSTDESSPGNTVQVGSSASSNPSYDPNRTTTNSLVDESKFQPNSIGEIVPSSGTGEASPGIQEAAPVKVEPMPAFDLGLTNAPTYNATIRFSGSALRPRASGVGFDTNGEGGCIYTTSGDPNVVWNLSLDLPQGAKIEWLRMAYYDNDPAHATTGWFTKYNLYGEVVNEWGVSSVDTPSKYSYSDVLITPTETIDYGSYSYLLNWRPSALSSNLQLCGFRLFYSLPPLNFLPVVNRP